ncbi:MAG: UbiA family prenyltransferase [Spirochaetales bacterium]|nr:UbiA family prenyltransferase [Spirochaetales bacterium]
MKRWLKFIITRFPPLAYIPLIAAFTMACFMLAGKAFAMPEYLSYRFIATAFITLLFFFHLRVFDEIKDYNTDIHVHPERPLASGAIRVKEAKAVAFCVVAAELLLGVFLGWAGFVGLVFAVGYSVLMYREFFIKQWLVKRMVMYALTHTPVSALLTLFLFSAFANLFFWQAPLFYVFFAFANWAISNVFEFSRKTFSADQETGAESYSKKWGIPRASLFVSFMLVVSSTFMLTGIYILEQNMLWFVLFGSLCMLSLGFTVLFMVKKTGLSARLFQGFHSASILLFYSIIITGVLV